MNLDIPPNPMHSDNTPHQPLTWIDSQSQTWSVLLSPNSIVLECGSAKHEFSSDAWQRDVYLSPTGEPYVVRFDRFDVSLSFVLSPEQAQPLLELFGHGSAAGFVESESADTQHKAAPILWPKVSPLALWALGFASIAFVPIAGFVASLVSIVLLTVHRRRVRTARAWLHSRRLCRSAIVLLILGVPISIQATRTLIQNLDERSIQNSSTSPYYQRGHSLRDKPTSTIVHVAHGGLLAERSSGNLFERDHNWGLILAGLLVVLFSLTVHEAAHAITAWWLGDDFAHRLGRVTLNPMAHIDPFGTVILPLALFLAGVGIFGFAKPVPVRTEVLERPRRGHILISLAGPGVNLLMAAVSVMLLLGIVQLVSFFAPHAKVTNLTGIQFEQFVSVTGIPLATLLGTICTMLKLSFLINTFLAFFNLIPIPPLDGSWVLEKLFPHSIGRLIERVRPYSMLVFLAAFYTNAFTYLLLPAIFALAPGLLILEMCTQLNIS